MQKNIFLALLFLGISHLSLLASDAKVTVDQTNRAGGTISIIQVDEVTFRLTANPDEGYSFLQWSDGETKPNRQYVHPADESQDMTLYAIFGLDEDMHSERGTIEVEQLSTSEEVALQFTAVPATGYSFYCWNNGDKASSVITYQESMGQRIPIFVPSSKTASVVYSTNVGGQVLCTSSADGQYMFTAVPSDGYTFLSWMDGSVTNPRSYTSVSQQDAQFAAAFTCNQTTQVPNGTVVTTIQSAKPAVFQLNAVPDYQASFYAWSNAVTTPTISYEADADQLIPYFVSSMPMVQIATTNHVGGAIAIDTVGQGQYDLHAIPEEGYEFLMWTDNGSTNPDRSVTFTSSSTTPSWTAYAAFQREEYIQRPYGSVTAEILDPDIPSFSLTAVAESNASFYAWDNANKSTQPITYTEEDGARYPIFESTVGNISYSSTNHPGGRIDTTELGANTFSVLATPNEGYTFLSWMDGSTANPRSYVHSAGATALSAAFYRQEDIQQQGGYATITIDSPTDHTFLLQAVPSANMSFLAWSNANQSSTISYQESDGQRYPYFVSTLPVITLVGEQHAGGTVSVLDTVNANTFRLLATPNEGYTFQQWADDATAPNPRLFTYASDEVLKAVFTRDADLSLLDGSVEVEVADPDIPSFTLTQTPNSGECAAEFYLWNNGAVTSSVPYIETDGQRIPYYTRTTRIAYHAEDDVAGVVEIQPNSCSFTLSAIPADGYTFLRWKEDNAPESVRDVDYAEGIYTAVFGKSPYRVDGIFYSTMESAIAASKATQKPVEVMEEVGGDVYITESVQLDANNHSIANLHVQNGVVLTLLDYLIVNNLYLSTTTGQSAQLIGYDEYLTCADAYLDITLEHNNTVASPDKWYAFSLPFDVDVSTGVARASGNGTHISGRDYLVQEFLGDARAANGKGWTKKQSGTMQAGKMYMIGIDGTENIWRFHKTSASPLSGSSSIALAEYPTADPMNARDPGWNGVGNCLLQYASASIPNVSYVQIYDNIQSCYMVESIEDATFVVGTPFFVQVPTATTLTLSPSEQTTMLYAPRRAALSASRYQLQLLRRSANNTYELVDRLYLTTSDEATNQYTIGRDVAKMMGGDTQPYLWSSAYGTRLCAHDAPMVDGVADFAVSLYAPKTGEYELRLVTLSEESVAVMRGGFVLSNLNDAPYQVHLDKGITDMVVRIGQTRQLPTSLDEKKGNADGDKFIYQDNLYIKHNQSIYDAQGKLVIHD